MRPALILTAADGAERRVLADLEGKPWAAQDGEPWHVSFALDSDLDQARAVELSVAPDITVALRGQPEVPGGATGSRHRSTIGTASAPRAKGDVPGRRPGARAQDLERLTTRLAAVEAALGREQEHRAEADAALDGQRAEDRRLSAELGRARAELELAQAAQREAQETATQLEGARREIASLQRRYDALAAEHERTLLARGSAQEELRRRSGELDSARDALGETRARLESAREQSARAQTARTEAAPAPVQAQAREPIREPRARADTRAAQFADHPPATVAHVAHHPAPPRSTRPVNPALRSRRKWLVRLLALVILAAFLLAVYLVLHSTVLH